MSAHTPGPWSVGPHPGNRAGNDWRMVVAGTPQLGPLYVAEALLPDARLIAAAPDMLAALREVAEYLGPESVPEYPSVQTATVNALIRNVRAAIAKVEG